MIKFLYYHDVTLLQINLKSTFFNQNNNHIVTLTQSLSIHFGMNHRNNIIFAYINKIII